MLAAFDSHIVGGRSRRHRHVARRQPCDARLSRGVRTCAVRTPSRPHGRTAVRAVVRPSVRIHVQPRHVAVEVDADDDVRPRDHIKRRIREIIATLRELERPA